MAAPFRLGYVLFGVHDPRAKPPLWFSFCQDWSTLIFLKTWGQYLRHSPPPHWIPHSWVPNPTLSKLKSPQHPQKRKRPSGPQLKGRRFKAYPLSPSRQDSMAAPVFRHRMNVFFLVCMTLWPSPNFHSICVPIWEFSFLWTWGRLRQPRPLEAHSAPQAPTISTKKKK